MMPTESQGGVHSINEADGALLASRTAGEPRSSYGATEVKVFFQEHPLTWSSLGVGVDGESRALRRRVILIYAGCARAQSRMTVLRREGTPSYRASQGDGVSVSQSCGACPPDRACLHPSTATPKAH